MPTPMKQWPPSQPTLFKGLGDLLEARQFVTSLLLVKENFSEKNYSWWFSSF